MEDMLIARCRPLTLAAGWALGAAVNSLLVALGALAVLLLFAPFPASPLALFAWLALGSMALAFAGVIVGIFAPRYDNVSFYDTLFVYPLLMLSGFLGTGRSLPPLGALLVDGNPLALPVRALRQAWMARPLSGTAYGEALLLLSLAALWLAAWALVARSPRLRR